MSTFAEEGFLSDEVAQGKSRIEKIYEKEFSICREFNSLLMRMQDEINPKNSRKEFISNIITARFTQNLQSTVILLSYAINSDSHSIIRNMQESYLALACLLKDEDFFLSINEYDLAKFKSATIKFIEESPYLSEKHENAKEKFEEAKKILSISLEDASEKKRPLANVLYEKTKDELESQWVYLDYRILSNTHCHISMNSFMQHYGEDENAFYVHFRGIKKEEMQSAMKKIIDVSTFFSLRIDNEFLNKKYDNEISTLMKNFYEYYIKTGIIIKNK